METGKIQELFFLETFIYLFILNLALCLLKLGYLGHSKVTSFLERRQTYTNLKETQFAKYPNW